MGRWVPEIDLFERFQSLLIGCLLVKEPIKSLNFSR